MIIFAFGLDDETLRVFAPVCESEGVTLTAVPMEAIHGATAMMARLFLNSFVPEQYTQYLYLDGDTQILGSLDPLVEAYVPAGHFLAANDVMTFQIEDMAPQSRELNKHLASIGITGADARSYFNSGVLRINRDGWEQIGQEAWERYLNRSGEAKFPDQDALNLVGAEHRLCMSLGWNFPVFLRNSRVEAGIKPRIWHFTSQPKPWQGIFPPWTIESYEPYAEMVERHPGLAPYHRVMPIEERVFYHLHQRRKRVIETVTWGYSARRQRILNYEMACSRMVPVPAASTVGVA